MEERYSRKPDQLVHRPCSRPCAKVRVHTKEPISPGMGWGALENKGLDAAELSRWLQFLSPVEREPLGDLAEE